MDSNVLNQSPQNKTPITQPKKPIVSSIFGVSISIVSWLMFAVTLLILLPLLLEFSYGIKTGLMGGKFDYINGKVDFVLLGQILFSVVIVFGIGAYVIGLSFRFRRVEKWWLYGVILMVIYMILAMVIA